MSPGDDGGPERNTSSISDSGPNPDTEANRYAVDDSKSFRNAKPETDSESNPEKTGCRSDDTETFTKKREGLGDQGQK